MHNSYSTKVSICMRTQISFMKTKKTLNLQSLGKVSNSALILPDLPTCLEQNFNITCKKGNGILDFSIIILHVMFFVILTLIYKYKRNSIKIELFFN